MKILVDNGHGADTAGKRSPDGKLLEYAWTREIAERIVAELSCRGYDAELVTPEETDVPLGERARRVNDECGRVGAANVVLVSVHVNAAGNGQWMSARGWSAYTSKGNTRSDELATLLYAAAAEHLSGQKMRKEFSDGDADWEENFYILRKTKCAAVLTENMFMDNKQDVEYLLSENGKRAVVKTHVDALMKYADRF